MILIIAVLAILLLISCMACHVMSQGMKEAQRVAGYYLEQYSNEYNITGELNQEIELLKAKLEEVQNPKEIPKEEPETGHFVKAKKMRPASPETYRNVFDIDINGQRVLDHLELVFAKKSTYVRGGQDAERESCFRAGQSSVIGFIFNQINKANNPEFYKDEVDD